MNPHWQFAVPHLVLSVIVVFHVLEELVGRSESHLDFSILFLSIKAEPIRCIFSFLLGLILKGAASVTTRTDVLHRNRNAALGNVGVYLAKDASIARQILIPIFMNVVCSWLMQGIDFAAVNALPNAKVRQLVVSRGTPAELLTMEAFLSSMMHEGRQSVGEAETIRQHHVVTASYAEFFHVEAVGIEHAMQDAFC